MGRCTGKPQESALEQPFQHRDRPEVAVNCLIAHASQSDPDQPFDLF